MRHQLKGWIAVSFAVLLGASLALPAAAKKDVKPGPAGKPASAASETSVTGPVKGSVTGKTFVIGRKGGPVTVDASKAKVRQAGRFVKLDTIKGGTMVTAKGTMSGTTLTATDVTVFPPKMKMKMSPTAVPAGKVAPAAPGGRK